jgi:DNA invertase Pin-like site-specific DNA recombinase
MTADQPQFVAYVRVSHQGNQADQREQLALQERICREYAASEGYEVIACYSDIGPGLEPTDRPGLVAALKEIRDGPAGGLVTVGLDRLARLPEHLEWVVEEIMSQRGVLLAKRSGLPPSALFPDRN